MTYTQEKKTQNKIGNCLCKLLILPEVSWFGHTIFLVDTRALVFLCFVPSAIFKTVMAHPNMWCSQNPLSFGSVSCGWSFNTMEGFRLFYRISPWTTTKGFLHWLWAENLLLWSASEVSNFLPKVPQILKLVQRYLGKKEEDCKVKQAKTLPGRQ